MAAYTLYVEAGTHFHHLKEKLFSAECNSDWYDHQFTTSYKYVNIIKISITDHNSQVAVSTAKNVHGLYCILPLGRSVMSTTEKRKSSSNTKIRLHGDRMVQACFFLLYFSPLPAYPGPPESLTDIIPVSVSSSLFLPLLLTHTTPWFPHQPHLPSTTSPSSQERDELCKGGKAARHKRQTLAHKDPLSPEQAKPDSIASASPAHPPWSSPLPSWIPRAGTITR